MNKAMQQALESKHYTLQLLRGRDGSGAAVFFYVLFRKDVFEKLKTKAAKGLVSLSKHGIVLFRGAGHAPSPEVAASVLKDFEENYLK